ncbi:hypothetical protein EII22_09020 [Coriobacteriales bacterium OH1046]|nr:hypothetical protein EII22_09020 [Coriobacteriales bacterium OH1046]
MADYVLSAKGTYDGSGFDGGIAESQSRLGSFLDQAKAVGQKVQGFLGTALVGVADGIAGAIGGIGASVAALAATGGINRALAIEQARYKLEQMGLDVESIMASALQSVKGTKFGLDAAATSATILGTSGVGAGEAMTRALETAAGIATISGDRMEDIADIMSKVASNGKLSGEHLLSFSARGINALDALSRYLGMAQSDVRDLVTKGEIDFQTFSDAMYAAFGTAASNANATFQGAWENVRAALSRMGLVFADPALGGLKDIFAALIPVIDSFTGALAPLGDAFASLMEKAVPKAVEWLGRLRERLDGLGEGGLMNLSAGAKAAAAVIGVLTVGSLGGLISQIPIVGGALGGLFGLLGKLAAPVGTLVKSFAGIQGALGPALATMSGPMVAGLAAVSAVIVGLVAAFGYLMATNEDFRATIGGLVADIGGTLSPCLDAIASIIPSIQAAFGSLVNIVSELAPAFLGLVAAIAPVITTVVTALAPIIGTVIEIGGRLLEHIASFLIPAINAIAELIGIVMPQIQGIITVACAAIQALIDAVWPFIEAVIVGTMEDIQTDIGPYWDAIKSIVEAAMSVIQSLIDAATAAISGDWDGAWNIIKTTFEDIWSSITETVGTLWEDVKSAFSDGVESIMSTVEGIPDKIMGFFADAGSWLLDAGESIMNGLKDGIENAIGSVTGAVEGALGAIRDFFPFSPAKVGPFSGKGWVLYSGMSIMDALAEGAESRSGRTMEAYSSIAVRLRESLDMDGIPGYGTGWQKSLTRDTYGNVRSGSGVRDAVGGPRYNIYIDGARVNDDAHIRDSVRNLLVDLSDRYAMGERK